MSAPQYAKAVEILQQTKLDIAAALEGIPMPHPLMQANTGLDNIINRFNFLSGNTAQKVAKTAHEPVTNFMGKPIERPKKVVPADLATTDQRKDNLRSKVKALYTEITTLEPEAWLRSKTTKEDELILRGVAKTVGLPDFQTADLTVKYFEQIQEAAKEKQLIDSQTQQVDSDLTEIENANDPATAGGKAKLTPQQRGALTKAANKANQPAKANQVPNLPAQDAQ